MTVMVTTERLKYPASKRAPEDVWKRWPERLRILRTCQVCCTTYLHAGAAYTCERSRHPFPLPPR